MRKNLKIIFLSTDTLHHRYIIKLFEEKKIEIEKYIFETTHVKPKFKVGPFLNIKTHMFEKKNFFKKYSNKIDTTKIVKVKNINSINSERFLKKIKPDLAIVFGTRKIDKKIISKFKFGLINVHRGIIEKYRGLDSDFWAVYHKDFNNIGATIHKVDENLDTGNVIDQKKLNLNNIKIYQLKFYTTILAGNMLVNILKKFTKEHKFKFKNIKRNGRYYSFMPLEIKKVLHMRS